MTAATDSATAAKGGWRVSGTVRHADEIRQQLTEVETGARPVPGQRAPVAATGGQTGRAPVTRGPEISRAATDSDGSPTTSAAVVSHLPPQVEAALPGDRRDSSGQSAPALASLVEGGRECAAVAYADGLDGAERKLLLHHIAQAWPEVVEAGAGMVAQWRAECAGRRRVAARRKDHDRRRDKRRQAGNRG